MENLIQRADKVNTGVLAGQIAEMEVYRIPQYVKMLVFNVYYFFLKFLGLFIRKCKDKSNRIEKKIFEKLLREREQELSENIDGMDAAFLRNVIHHVRISNLSPFCSAKNQEKLSSLIIKSASNIVKRNKLVGKSVYERKDLVFSTYSERKRPDPATYLQLWFFVSIVAAVSCILLPRVFYFDISMSVLIPATIAIEILIYLFFCRKMSIRHMARLIWIITSETGGIRFDENIQFPTCSKDQEILRLINLRMRALHSLIKSSNVLVTEQKRLKDDMERQRNQVRKNKEIIGSIQKKEDEEGKRVLRAKEEEIAFLEKKIEETSEQINKTENEKENTDLLINSLKEWLIPQFDDAWKTEYKTLNIPKNMIDKIVSIFSVDEIRFLEKRFYEIENTSDPTTIAKRRNGRYFTEFLTAGNGLALLYFDYNKTNSIAGIAEVERKDELSEPFVSSDELNEAISGIGDNQRLRADYEKKLKDLRLWYSDEVKNWESQKEELACANEKLNKEKELLFERIEEKQKEIDELALQIESKSADCIKLQSLLDKMKDNPDDGKIKSLQHALDEYKKQLAVMKRDYDKKVNENHELYGKIDDINKERDSLLRTIDNIEKDSQEKINEYKEIIEDKERTIKELSDKEVDSNNQIALLNGLLKKAKEKADSSAIDRETLAKLENNLNEECKKKTALEEENEKLKKEVDGLKKEKDEAQELVKKKNNHINDFKKDLQNAKTDILYDKAIYNRVYKWISEAKSYVYIVSPFVGQTQGNYMKEQFRDALGKNPDLKIKLLYGLKDPDYEDSSNESRLETAREVVNTLKNELGPAFGAKEGNTHMKLVIMDDERYMMGSANVMSFFYANKSGLHSEIMVESKDKKQIVELKKKFFGW